MNNVFDSSSYPATEPESIVAGSRVAWQRPDVSSVYSTDDYSLKYKIVTLDEVKTVINVSASKVGGVHVVEIPTATTGTYIAAEYKWSAIIVRDSDSEEATIDQGFLTIIPDGADEDNSELAWAHQTLKAIRATIKGTASQEQASYSINGRSLLRRTPEELMTLEKDFSRRVEALKAKENMKAGRKSGSRVLVKMGA